MGLIWEIASKDRKKGKRKRWKKVTVTSFSRLHRIEQKRVTVTSFPPVTPYLSQKG
jgi:hypothetical protein